MASAPIDNISQVKPRERMAIMQVQTNFIAIALDVLLDLHATTIKESHETMPLRGHCPNLMLSRSKSAGHALLLLRCHRQHLPGYAMPVH